MRGRRITKYQEVASALRQEIVNGTFPAGTQLSLSRELSGRFGVGPAVINNSIRILRSEGLIVAKERTIRWEKGVSRYLTRS